MNSKSVMRSYFHCPNTFFQNRLWFPYNLVLLIWAENLVFPKPKKKVESWAKKKKITFSFVICFKVMSRGSSLSTLFSWWFCFETIILLLFFLFLRVFTFLGFCTHQTHWIGNRINILKLFGIKLIIRDTWNKTWNKSS